MIILIIVFYQLDYNCLGLTPISQANLFLSADIFDLNYVPVINGDQQYFFLCLMELG